MCPGDAPSPKYELHVLLEIQIWQRFEASKDE